MSTDNFIYLTLCSGKHAIYYCDINNNGVQVI